MAQQVFSVKVDGRQVAKFRADLAQAAAPVEVWGDGAWVGTQWQTASGKHSEARIAALILAGDPDTEQGDAFTVECNGRNVGQGVIGSHLWGETTILEETTHQRYIEGGAYGVMGTPGENDWSVVASEDGTKVSETDPLCNLLSESEAMRKAESMQDDE